MHVSLRCARTHALPQSRTKHPYMNRTAHLPANLMLAAKPSTCPQTSCWLQSCPPACKPHAGCRVARLPANLMLAAEPPACLQT
eukprot:366069-Chlamydomonas_euryale.AAC.12